MTSRFSRREFLQSSATAAGALVASNSIFLEPDPAMASMAPVPASDRVRFGMIGVGMQGSALLDTSYHLPGVDCAASCDLYDGRNTLAREVPNTCRADPTRDRRAAAPASDQASNS